MSASKQRTRVVQWATGAVGTAQLQEVIQREDLELVGVFVYNGEKQGLDAGELCHLGATGVLATTDREQIMALDADVVLHAAAKVNRGAGDNVEDIARLLASGKNVITTTTYNHLPTYGADVARRFADACDAGGSSFLAAGENPGFMMQRLAATVSGLSKRVDQIVLEEYFDTAWMTSPEMVFDGMLMGAPPDAVTKDAPTFRVNDVQYRQELAATADQLGIELTRTEADIEVATVGHDIHTPAGVIRAGTVAAQRLTWTGYWQDRPYLVIRETWAMTRDVEGWGLRDVPNWDHADHFRITVEGLPRLALDLDLSMDLDGNDEQERALQRAGVSPAHLMIGMTAVSAIPAVLSAGPGIVTPAVFGAYQAGVRSARAD